MDAETATPSWKRPQQNSARNPSDLTMIPRCRVSLAAVLCLYVAAQAPRERMIIGTDVACRAEPRRDAMPRRVYRLGELIAPAQEIQTEGATWYSAERGCWVFCELTVEIQRSNAEPALVAAADHALNRKSATFEELVAVDNLLSGELFGRNVLDSSGLLQFRRLEVLRRIAVDHGSKARQVSREPLKQAWFLAHRDVIRPFDSDDAYFMQVEPYWALHDKYPNQTWSEELAWTAAQIPIPSDECYSDCVFDKIERTYAGYWKRYPGGKSVNEALAKAIPMATYAVQMSLYDTPPQPLLQRLRRTLDSVSNSAKAPLLDLLGEAERKYSVNR